ncbi:TPA: hypothetical protein N0F65_002040 [Lagenidium giganteum]|uniref:Secreted protein n=1 Tax=Lagenidium giganteum TaxID=4803 RepID=A0AAV2ZHJ9_9STRA|nr:TPA: hypothetical protein N0F65_002040 [Lagenidium giganteum]
MRYTYFLLVIGEVCRNAFCNCFDVSTPKLARYRRLVEVNHFVFPTHGGTRNKNAQRVDADALVAWFTDFAKTTNSVIPVRVRKQETARGTRLRTATTENHIVLPCYLTWEKLHSELLKTWNNRPLSEPSFRRARCPTTHIQSPRDHVCDTCVPSTARSSRTRARRIGLQ